MGMVEVHASVFFPTVILLCCVTAAPQRRLADFGVFHISTAADGQLLTAFLTGLLTKCGAPDLRDAKTNLQAR